MASEIRTIKKYPNRRLYDTANSGYITLADVKQMVLDGLDFRVVDAKTNEHKAALPLLRSLILTGRVVTGDAMLCQREVCREIRDRGGHYFFAVKENQPSLQEAVAAEFRAAFSPLHRA